MPWVRLAATAAAEASAAATASAAKAAAAAAAAKSAAKAAAKAAAAAAKAAAAATQAAAAAAAEAQQKRTKSLAAAHAAQQSQVAAYAKMHSTQTALGLILRELKRKFPTFDAPVHEQWPEAWEEYRARIAWPLCLRDVEQRFREGVYPTPPRRSEREPPGGLPYNFVVDIDHIASNAMRFNPPGHPLQSLAREYAACFRSLVDDISPCTCPPPPVAPEVVRPLPDPAPRPSRMRTTVERVLQRIQDKLSARDDVQCLTVLVDSDTSSNVFGRVVEPLLSNSRNSKATITSNDPRIVGTAHMYALSAQPGTRGRQLDQQVLTNVDQLFANATTTSLLSTNVMFKSASFNAHFVHDAHGCYFNRRAAGGAARERLPFEYTEADGTYLMHFVVARTPAAAQRFGRHVEKWLQKQLQPQRACLPPPTASDLRRRIESRKRACCEQGRGAWGTQGTRPLQSQQPNTKMQRSCPVAEPAERRIVPPLRARPQLAAVKTEEQQPAVSSLWQAGWLP